ncbi:MAG: hypothetical protein HY455_03530 [Parcubacteria group bacterium]|nr:hypothetical protein [Parcubacteria group bacterium]
MSTNIKVYKANKYYTIALLFVPIFLGVVFLLGDNPMTTEKWIGFSILSGMAILIALIPFAGKLEVGSNYARTYFLNFPVTTIQISDVQAIQYGKLFRGGLGYGNGLNIRFVVNGKSKFTSIGENLYGIEAIAHVSRVLGVGKISSTNEIAITKALQKESDIKSSRGYLVANKHKLIGSGAILLSTVLFFVGLFAAEGNSSSSIKFLIPVSIVLLIFSMGYTIVKTK